MRPVHVMCGRSSCCSRLVPCAFRPRSSMRYATACPYPRWWEEARASQEAGARTGGPEPVHQGKDAVLFVNDDKRYHCFSSGKHGDIFTFLMEVEAQLSRGRGAAGGEAGLQMPKADPGRKNANASAASLYEIVWK
ncbi:MAG: CHC2 zinc finger domain-containing protein [Tepidamorphaceae bacterium]